MATHEILNACGLDAEAVLASNHKRRRDKAAAFSILERDKIKRAADFISAHSIDVTALEWEFVGHFQREDSNRLFQSFSSRNAKKKRKASRRLPFWLLLRWLIMDFGLVSLLVNLHDPFRPLASSKNAYHLRPISILTESAATWHD
jgi:hypothetical protein